LKIPFSLSSDTWSPAHETILAAIAKYNVGYAEPYGEDAVTQQAVEVIQEIFTGKPAVHFVFNGTGANVSALSTCASPGSGIICTDSAHINVHEAGAPEALIGAKLLTVPHQNGKLTPHGILQWKDTIGNRHFAPPSAVAISQTTEYGTVYTLEEIHQITKTAHELGLYVFLDGARFANAIAGSEQTAPSQYAQSGVDVMTFGGTKNGLVLGEALLFFNPTLATRFITNHKQYLQLPTKNRYIAGQFLAYCENNLWIDLAQNANRGATFLSSKLKALTGEEPVFPVDSNMVFWKLNDELRTKLPSNLDTDSDGVTRFVVSHCVTTKQIEEFLAF
jgi:threonine aldolase